MRLFKRLLRISTLFCILALSSLNSFAQSSQTSPESIAREAIGRWRPGFCVNAIYPIEDRSSYSRAEASCGVTFEGLNPQGQPFREHYSLQRSVRFNSEVGNMAGAAVRGAGPSLGVSLIFLLPSALAFPFTGFVQAGEVREVMAVCRAVVGFVEAHKMCQR